MFDGVDSPTVAVVPDPIDDSGATESDGLATTDQSPGSVTPAQPAEAAPVTPGAAAPEAQEVGATTQETEGSLDALANENEVQVSQSLDLSTVSQVIADSILQAPTNSEYIALKDGIDINADGVKFTVNTLYDDLKLRDATGSEIGSVAKGTTVDTAKEFKIFIPSNSPSTKVLMIKVTANGQEGYLAAPYLKLYDPNAPVAAPAAADTTGSGASATPPVAGAAAPSAAPESINNGVDIVATNMNELRGVGDSIGEGMHGAGFTNIDFARGRRTGAQLTRLRQLLESNQVTAENTKSFLIYGAGNDIGQGSGNVDQAISNTRSMVQLLKTAGIQPIVCTMYDSLSDTNRNNLANLTPDQIAADPRMQAIARFNQGVRGLATTENIPLIEMAGIPNPTYNLHPGGGVYSQMVDRIRSSLA
jgi:lysophospholipase L1-like esterase